MNKDKYVFTQIAEFLPARIFDRCVAGYSGNKKVRKFTCWNQLMCMMFGQISNRESLRDLITCLDAHDGKHYHLGMGKNVSRSTLAEANEKRDFRIYEEFSGEMIRLARESCGIGDFKLEIEGNVYAFDASVIDLCLNVFWWAEFRKEKGAVKLHTLFDVKTSIPAFMHITNGKVHDVNGLDELRIESGAWYIMDRGYVDFERLHRINLCDAHFVIRAKRNLRFTRLSSNTTKDKSIRSDQMIRLSGGASGKKYPEQLRRIRFHDAERNRFFVFLTNDTKQEAVDIATLYKYRWRVELFFKWIKQHLKIKSFWGTSFNAVKTQIHIAIITYCLISIMKNKMKLNQSTYEIIQILGVSFLDKTPVNQLFANQYHQDVKELNHNQLKLNLI